MAEIDESLSDESMAEDRRMAMRRIGVFARKGPEEGPTAASPQRLRHASRRDKVDLYHC